VFFRVLLVGFGLFRPGAARAPFRERYTGYIYKEIRSTLTTTNSNIKIARYLN
jgi:hypothetical protein